MTSFATVHRNPTYGGTRAPRYYWLIFSQNMRRIAASPRSYNQPHHARAALKRFIRCVGGCHVRPGIVND